MELSKKMQVLRNNKGANIVSLDSSVEYLKNVINSEYPNISEWIIREIEIFYNSFLQK